jgi:glycerol-3-phosphate dehydrogenase (NAD+)
MREERQRGRNRRLKAAIKAILAVLCLLLLSQQLTLVSSASSPTTDSSNDVPFRRSIEQDDTNTDNMPRVDRSSSPPLTRVCVIGSGNWGSAMATLIGGNCARLPFCESTVRMWVHEEDVTLPDGRVDKLTNVINEQHENVKYLPGVALPPNVVAVPALATACAGATLLIFVLPHQFLPNLLPTIRAHMGLGCRGVSLIKGLGRSTNGLFSVRRVVAGICILGSFLTRSSCHLWPTLYSYTNQPTLKTDFDPETKSPVLISQTIEAALGPGFSCGVLMGANVANEVARGDVCESTLATRYPRAGTAHETRQILQDPATFRIQLCRDVVTAEVCGALKNVVALGAGFCDGLGLGGNTKAALLRVGLLEMRRFCQACFTDRQHSLEASTFWESCGVADLITTCYGGRNRKCAEAFARRVQTESVPRSADGCVQLWRELETDLLGGQKLQGTLTCDQVYQIVSSRGLSAEFPLLTIIYEIALGGRRTVAEIVQGIRVAEEEDQGLPSSRL